MNFVDVNLLVYAYRTEMDHHSEYREWLDKMRRSNDVLGIPSAVVSGFLRVITNPKIFKQATPIDRAWEFCDAILAGPTNVVVEPGPRHLRIFRDLCLQAKAGGKLIPDAHLAAMAIEAGATWYSADGDFGRFVGLDWRHPLDDDPTPTRRRARGRR